jgi:acyl-CoA synthetase (AMP-forming)/AMP-acid ligase II/aryl carrier-like protein
MPSLASFAFDIWLLESLLPLLHGGVVRIVPRETVLELPALVEEIGSATLLHAVPALMRQVVEGVRATRGSLPGVRRAFVGGDAVPPDLPARMREVFPRAEVRVLYGPTEATIICAAHLVAGDVGGRHLLGRPIGNAQLYVLEPGGRPAPVGVPGELCVGGRSVARDYLGRPGLTAERFVPDPHTGEPGARMYRTGDRARWAADGVLEFLGRIDQQVKVRGFRVEPGEIEAALLRHGGVGACAVAAREAGAGERRLVAYVVPRPGSDAPAAGELRRFLARRLPDYMVPAAFVALEGLPLTPNGKIDRARLPAPDGRPELAVDYAPPGTPAQETLAGICAELLGRERVGVHDNFFELGGDSILCLQLASRAREAGLRLTTRDVFRHQTVAAMAAGLDEAEPEAGVEPGGGPLDLAAGEMDELLYALGRAGEGEPA